MKFYEQDETTNFCPDGTVAGETAIGAIAYSEYTQNFTELYLTPLGGLIRNYNYCITLPVPFLAQPGKVYFVSASADFPFQLGSDGLANTQWFNRMFEGAYDPYCEASWWDTWSGTEVPWNAISIPVNVPCWTGWNIGFVLYSNYVPPPTGACCIPGVACFVTTQDQCTDGTWYPDVTCDPDPCAQPFGACCYADLHCEYVQQAQCGSSDWREGVPCDLNPCSQSTYGACCDPTTGECYFLLDSKCPSYYTWQEGVPCDPNPCPQPPLGACCWHYGYCSFIPQYQCHGLHWYEGVPCDPNPCGGVFGACCWPDGSCSYGSVEQCGGQFLGDVPCDPFPCDAACCFADGTCQMLTQAECGASQGQWQGGGVRCDPNPCPPPVPVERTTWGRIKSEYR